MRKPLIAGQDSSHLGTDGTKQTSKPSQTLFYQWRDWHYWSMSHLTHHSPEVPVFYYGCRYCPWQGACQALNKPRNRVGNDPELACHLCVFEEGTHMTFTFLNTSCVFSSLIPKENIFYSSFNED